MPLLFTNSSIEISRYLGVELREGLTFFSSFLQISHNEASIYDGKTYKTINVPGATETIVEGINSEGDVVYQWINAVGVSHSALRHAGKYFKFDYPKAVDTWGGGINDENTIIGAYANSKQSSLGYKATYK